MPIAWQSCLVCHGKDENLAVDERVVNGERETAYQATAKSGAHPGSGFGELRNCLASSSNFENKQPAKSRAVGIVVRCPSEQVTLRLHMEAVFMHQL